MENLTNTCPTCGNTIDLANHLRNLPTSEKQEIYQAIQDVIKEQAALELGNFVLNKLKVMFIFLTLGLLGFLAHYTGFDKL